MTSRLKLGLLALVFACFAFTGARAADAGASTPAAAPAGTSSTKKGVGTADLDDGGPRIAALNVAWYYTWKSSPVADAPSTVEFVPMVRGGEHLEEDIAGVKSRGKAKVMLVFNEPDVKRAKIRHEEFPALWPRVTPLAERIASPAASSKVMERWYHGFMQVQQQQRLKVDFLAIHIYGPPDPAAFLKRVDSMYDAYHKPLWITEFAVQDWDARNKPTGSNRYSEEQVLAFMKAVLPELERRKYVERYAWFGSGTKYIKGHEQIRTSRLFESNGSLSALGQFYASFPSAKTPQ